MSDDTNQTSQTNQRERLQNALKAAQEGAQEGGKTVLDTSDADTYDHVTEGNPERGLWRIVGGYVDDEGVLHNEVELRAMTGHEEDLLASRSMPPVYRLNAILSQCITRLGTITDRSTIHRAVQDMPSGSRTHLLILLRVTSHWATEKSIYRMAVRCPSMRCQHDGTYDVDLLTLDQFSPDDDVLVQQTHELKLPSGKVVEWRPMSGVWDHVMDVWSAADRGSHLTQAIVARIVKIDGKVVGLSPSDILAKDDKTIRKMLSAQAAQLVGVIKSFTTSDREAMRADFDAKEPGVDTEISVKCSSCDREFITVLDLGQDAFFFPQMQSARLRKKHSS